MKESHRMENLVLDVFPCLVIPMTPAVRTKVDELRSSHSSNPTPTPAALAGCEAEDNLMSTFNIVLYILLEIIRILRWRIFGWEIISWVGVSLVHSNWIHVVVHKASDILKLQATILLYALYSLLDKLPPIIIYLWRGICFIDNFYWSQKMGK